MASLLVKSGSDWLAVIGLIFVVLLILLTSSLLIRAFVSY